MEKILHRKTLRAVSAVDVAKSTDVVQARFRIGQLVTHAQAGFVGVVMDIDPSYAGKDQELGEIEPHQPFYRLLVAGSQGHVLIYAPEDSLTGHVEGQELHQRERDQLFTSDAVGHLTPRGQTLH